MTTKHMAIGIDNFGGVWEYLFDTINDASEFIEAVGDDSLYITWRIKEVTDSVWSVGEAADHFNSAF